MSLEEFAATFCSNVECEDCPVYKEKYETRSLHEKYNQHVPCCENLIKWLKDKAKIWTE